MPTTVAIWLTAPTWFTSSEAPVYAGDFIEAEGWIDREGNTSRHMMFEARKVAQARPDISPSAADELDEPILVCRASGTCVTPKDCQRKK